MAIIRLGHKWMIVALLLAAFFIVPVSEAISCAGETDTVNLLVSLDDVTHQDNQNDRGDIDTCSHGHCHHTTAHMRSTLQVSFDPIGALLSQRPDENELYAHSPDRLIRPPKV